QAAKYRGGGGVSVAGSECVVVILGTARAAKHAGRNRGRSCGQSGCVYGTPAALKLRGALKKYCVSEFSYFDFSRRPFREVVAVLQGRRQYSGLWRAFASLVFRNRSQLGR